MLIDTKLIRRKILDLAIRGKLVPQDPADEPASELLKRINAEKAALIKSGKIKKEKPLPPISKDEIPFDIPDSWEWVRLGDVCQVKGGKRVPQGDKLLDSPTAHVYLRVTDMKDGTINDSPKKYISEETFQKISKYTISSNDLYVTIAGTIGLVGVIPDQFDGMNLTENAAKLTDIYINRNFLAKQLNASFFQEVFLNKRTQVAQPKLALERIATVLFPLPPLEEQNRIVAKVEALMNEVDTIERETENLNRTFALTREKVLDLAIRGKLVPQDPTDEPASELLKRIQAEKASLIKSGKLKKEKPLPPISESDIPFPIPPSWSWVRLASLGTVVGGGTPSTILSEYWDGAIPWLSPCDLSDYDGKYIGHGKRNISQEGLDHSSAALMPVGSILYSSRAPIGYVVIASNEISTNQGFKSLVPAIDGINEFIYYALKALTPDIKNRATGTTFKEISGSEFGKTLFPLPPLAEQKRIVEKLETILSTLDAQQ